MALLIPQDCHKELTVQRLLAVFWQCCVQTAVHLQTDSQLGLTAVQTVSLPWLLAIAQDRRSSLGNLIFL